MVRLTVEIPNEAYMEMQRTAVNRNTTGTEALIRLLSIGVFIEKAVMAGDNVLLEHNCGCIDKVEWEK